MLAPENMSPEIQLHHRLSLGLGSAFMIGLAQAVSLAFQPLS